MKEKNTKEQVSIVIPVYNEENDIRSTLDTLLNSLKTVNFDYEIIVVNDGSTDKTADLIKNYDVKLVQHEHNKGYGAALKTGILSARYDIIAMSDADGSYPVNRILDMIKYIGDFDMVVGARNRSYAKVSLVRHLVKWSLNKYANYLVKEKIPDLNSGLRVFKKDVYEEFKRLLPNGFSFTTTITLALLSNNYRVKYIDIEYFKRGGKSKFKPISDTINFFSLITRTSLYFNPLRIYMPIALSLIAVGIIFLGNDIYMMNITEKTVMIIFWGMQFGAIGLLADMISRQRR